MNDETLSLEDYKDMIYDIRNTLNCGHVKNCPDEVYKIRTRLWGSMAKIVTLEKRLSRYEKVD